MTMTVVVQAPAALNVSIERCPSPLSDGLTDTDAAWPSCLRRIVRACLTHWRSPGLIDTAEVLLTELVTNALRHDKGNSISVRMLLDGDRCVIEVTDGSSDRPELCCAGPDDEGGRGLILVDSLAEAWGVSRDGTTTWCSLPLTKRTH
ncbi:MULTISPECIES: ATP-binding protein [unclassified Streptomyces]|uniref:ATP-binding protein n=1 Tax=unclassified Streptomyces TaxID=2593676 RepID=UPI0036E97B69